MTVGSGSKKRPLGLVALALSLTAVSGWAEGIDFVHEIVPLLEKHCGECHIGDARQGGYSLNTREAVLAGGDSGLAGIVPGESDASELLRRIRSADPDERMPADGEPIPADEVALMARWIDAGAPWEPGFAFNSNLWEPPLALREVVLPPAREGRGHPIDRLIDQHFADHNLAMPAACDDRSFFRRVSLDLTGLLPAPAEVEAYVADTSPTKRAALIDRLLGDDFDARLRYAEHWLTFFNDLLRNDYNGTGFITGGRKQISSWLHRSLVENKPYDQMVRELIAPSDESRGFIDGIVWRGTVNSSQTVPIQFAQNVGQSFLGINLKCASCHDSFVDRWTLQQTYDFAAILSSEPLELHRCDKATGTMATPGWMFEELGQVDPARPPEERLEQLAALITSRDNGWLSRSIANRLWARLMGRGIVHPVDALRTTPWNEDLLELLASDLVEHGWDLKHLLRTICTSEAYAAVTPAAASEPSSSQDIWAGPLPRRMTAEQFFDALWQLTGTAPAQPDGEMNRFDPDAAAVDASPPQAVWIWSNEAASSAPSEALTFRREFTLDDPVATATAVFAADNMATVFLNGTKLASSESWSEPVSVSLLPHLRSGTNVLRVEAANAAAGGPAALLLEARLLREDNTAAVVIATDDTWQWRPHQDADDDSDDSATWQQARQISNQATWQQAAAAFAAQLQAAATGPAPMVRAALKKATPLMRALGRPNRDQVLTSRPTELTTLEAIQLANEQSLADELLQGGERLHGQLGPDTNDIATGIFAAALNRAPNAEELAACHEILGAEPTGQTVADCLWAVMMLPEFQLVR